MYLSRYEGRTSPLITSNMNFPAFFAIKIKVIRKNKNKNKNSLPRRQLPSKAGIPPSPDSPGPGASYTAATGCSRRLGSSPPPDQTRGNGTPSRPMESTLSPVVGPSDGGLFVDPASLGLYYPGRMQYWIHGGTNPPSACGLPPLAFPSSTPSPHIRIDNITDGEPCTRSREDTGACLRLWP
jgi:hypothetical protein